MHTLDLEHFNTEDGILPSVFGRRNGAVTYSNLEAFLLLFFYHSDAAFAIPFTALHGSGAWRVENVICVDG